MAVCLADGSPLFRDILTDCDTALATLSDAPSWSIVNELSKPEEESRVHLAEFSQPLCTSIQLAIVALLRSWGLKPVAVIGHSSGEIAAAYAAGYTCLCDAIMIARYCGLVLRHSLGHLSQSAGKKVMCAVGLCEKDSRELIADFADRVQLAAVNSPDSCTLSGEAQAIDDIITKCKQHGHVSRKLRVDQGKILH